MKLLAKNRKNWWTFSQNLLKYMYGRNLRKELLTMKNGSIYNKKGLEALRRTTAAALAGCVLALSLIHISEPTRL